jgi:predicted O-linked N-acetylglucosamine transferase (SPINDLY family)
LHDAISVYQEAIRVTPPCSAIHNNLGNLWLRLGRIDEALGAYRTALAIDPDHPAVRSNYLFSLLYKRGLRRTDILREHRVWGRRHAASSFEQYDNLKQPGRRLRVGYLSSGFYLHPKYFLIRPIIATHDRRRFVVFCYSNSPRKDEFSQSFQRFCDHWRNIYGRNDVECAGLIRRDKIDILVDLDGHFGGNRLPVFAMRPAPVQVSLPGYPYTTGVEAIQYRLTDDIIDPPGAGDGEYVEELIRLPGSFACYRPARSCPPVASVPAISNGYVTFACFNARQKYSDGLLGMWATILKSVPRSRLLLHHAFNGQPTVTSEFRRPIVEVLRREGISSRRIEMIGGLPLEEHFETYSHADIMLDTYPYNGMTTTFESLWMGVPVVTLFGRAHLSRVGLSLLTRAGLTEWVCSTPSQYVRTAIRLGSDVAELTNLRSTLRNRVNRTPPFDAHAHTREVEFAYRLMWHRWCHGATPS